MSKKKRKQDMKPQKKTEKQFNSIRNSFSPIESDSVRVCMLYVYACVEMHSDLIAAH